MGGESICDNAFWYHVKITFSFSYHGGRCNTFSYSQQFYTPEI